MLGTIPGIFFPPETQYLMATKRRQHLLGEVATDKGFRNTIRAIIDSCQRNELPVNLGKLEAELNDTSRDYASLFDTLLWHIQSNQPDCRRLGEKSPDHLQQAEFLLEHFPDAQIINIIRDGRDTALSRKQSFGTQVLRSSIVWKQDQQTHFKLKQKLSEQQYSWVRYEDLIRSPETELRRLCDFLNETYSEQMLEFYKRKNIGFAARESHKQQTLEPLSDSRIARYKNQLGDLDVALVQALAGKELVACGYPLEPVSNWLGYVKAISQIPGVIAERIKFKREFKKRLTLE